MFALPIFTASRPATIVGVHVLNFCVRDGNRWTHMTINTNLFGWLLTIFYIKAFSSSNTLYPLPLPAQQTSAAFASGSDEP